MIMKKEPAPDDRIEVCCKKCNAHTGHIFVPDGGGRFGQRHCVNDSAIQYLVYDPPEGSVGTGKVEALTED